MEKFNFGCGLAVRSSGEKEIVFAGGSVYRNRRDDYLDSVEILNIDSMVWRKSGGCRIFL